MGSSLSVPFLVNTLEPRYTTTLSRSRDWGRGQEPQPRSGAYTALKVARNKLRYGLPLKCAFSC